MFDLLKHISSGWKTWLAEPYTWDLRLVQVLGLVSCLFWIQQIIFGLVKSPQTLLDISTGLAIVILLCVQSCLRGLVTCCRNAFNHLSSCLSFGMFLVPFYEEREVLNIVFHDRERIRNQWR